MFLSKKEEPEAQICQRLHASLWSSKCLPCLYVQTAAISTAWFERAKMRFPLLLFYFKADCDADLAIPKSETSDSSQKSLASTKLVIDKCGYVTKLSRGQRTCEQKAGLD